MLWSRYDIILEITSASLAEAVQTRSRPNKIIYVKLDEAVLTEDAVIDGSLILTYRMRLNAGSHLLDIKIDDWGELKSLKLAAKQDGGVIQHVPLQTHLPNDIVSIINNDYGHIVVRFTTWE
jgi:hypothetical protein